MFVSSYNTYVNTNNSDRNANHKVDKAKNSSTLFESKLAQNSVIESKDTQNLPITYISNYKSFNNKQKLQEQLENKDGIKFNKINDIKNAKEAYADNSVMFPLLSKPKTTQSQILQIDRELPMNLQEAQEKQIRHNMVNTYLANDKYYQITA
ncbi:hypothetical protein [Sulfurimonas sp.]|uniref:hypothetical protein n=1 Tax=Sulfurimonas sp. TaxID=2022749 RepID=UPI0025D94CFA|nr:hypothetical protein [Sulfurimonas sp.]